MAVVLKSKSASTIQKSLGIDDSGLVQKYLGKLVTDRLRDYVSYKTGTQEASVTQGNKEVIINVPYAEAQAYNPIIKKRVGKRGTRPFERMVNDNAKTIESEMQAYSKRVAK